VHRRDRGDVIALGIEGIRIGAEPQKRPRRVMAAQKRRDMQRRSAVGILNVGLFALTDQLLDLGSVAARGRVGESGVDAQLPLARRRLRDAYPAAQLGGANHENKAKKASRHGPACGQTSSTPQDTTTWTSLTPLHRVDGVARLKVAVVARAAG